MDESPTAPPPSSFNFFEYHRIDLAKPNKPAKFAKQYEEEKWIVLEKVHGANFSFYSDGKTIACSRRNAMLDDSETFYNFQAVREKYRKGVVKLFQEIKKRETADVKSIALFGELFGGIYPHVSVEDLGYLHVQKGVYYTNTIDFYAFDVWVNVNNGEGYWLNYFKAMELFEMCEFFYAKPLLVGSLTECFQFDYAINSTIPALLGLPPLPKNQMEGIVVKSGDPIPMKGNAMTRVIYKLKNKKFEEVNPKVEATKHEKLRDKKKLAVDTCYEEIERYINENRLDSVRSKIGPVTAETTEKTAVHMHADIMKDFCADFADLWLDAEGSQQYVTSSTKSKVNTFIAEYLRKNAN